MGVMAAPRLGLIAAMAATMALAGCGYKSSLTRLPLATDSMGQAEKDALAEQKAQEKEVVETGLSVPSTINPERIDELRFQLDERPIDPFALPPEGTHGNAPVPFPEAGEKTPEPDQFLKNGS